MVLLSIFIFVVIIVRGCLSKNNLYMAKYTKTELALEIEQAKRQLRERERERESRIMEWCFLVMNSLLTGVNL
jgi:hypothetical protein